MKFPDTEKYFLEKYISGDVEVRGTVTAALQWTDESESFEECEKCEGLGGFPCQFCHDEQQCTHYERCDHCGGTGYSLG